MEFLILSDSHGKVGAIRAAFDRQIKKPDAVFFLGDGLRDIEDRIEGIPVIRVRGNCDWGCMGDVPEEQCLTLEGHRILLTHGHRYGVKRGVGGLLSAAEARNADLILYGHTHCPETETVPAGSPIGNRTSSRAITLFNPGSIGENGSFGTLTLLPDTVLFGHGRL